MSESHKRRTPPPANQVAPPKRRRAKTGECVPPMPPPLWLRPPGLGDPGKDCSGFLPRGSFFPSVGGGTFWLCGSQD